jgi:two-component system nitrate/nitrite sensor histidine kinase NarX
MAEYIEEFGLQTGIEIEFIDQIQADIHLSSIAEVQLVCILQEALTNVRKHAQASHVEVLLTQENRSTGEFIALRIRDDGRGFEPHESRRSFGIKTMGERAFSVNGELKIHSALNQGTTVHCALPYLAPDRLIQRSRDAA